MNIKKFYVPIFLLLVLIVSGVYVTQYSVFTENKPSVSIPVSSSLQCSVCGDGTVTKDIQIEEPAFSFTRGYNYEIYSCGSGDYAPKDCRGSIKGTSGSGETFFYVCSENSDVASIKDDGVDSLGLGDGFSESVISSKISGCTLKREVNSGETESFKMAQNQLLHVITENAVTGTMDYEPFCLAFEEANNEAYEFNGCDLSPLLGSSIRDIPSQFQDGGILTADRGKIQNVITGYVTFDDYVNIVKRPSNNEWVYLSLNLNRELVYYELEEDINSKVYVDLNGGAKKDSDFVCLPALDTSRCIEGTSYIEGKVGDEGCGADRVLGDFILLEQTCTKVCKDNEIDYVECVDNTNPLNVVIPKKEICDNGVDDDNNGLVDGNDPVCGDKDFNPLSLILIILTIAGGIYGTVQLNNLFNRKHFKGASLIAMNILTFVGVSILVFLIAKYLLSFVAGNFGALVFSLLIGFLVGLIGANHVLIKSYLKGLSFPVIFVVVSVVLFLLIKAVQDIFSGIGGLFF